jgi:hypothetical protein
LGDGESFAGRLLPGERVLWSGRPATGLLLTSTDYFAVPFSLLWTLFAVAFVGMAGFREGGVASVLFGAVFVGAGGFATVGRFIVDAWLRGGTRYAVTNRRVLILRSRPFPDFTAAALDRLPQARLRERRDGRGTLRFGAEREAFGFGRGALSAWLPSLDPTPQFLLINDARHVFELVQRGAAQAGG